MPRGRPYIEIGLEPGFAWDAVSMQLAAAHA